MAHAAFPVEVLTPEGSVFKDDVEMISTRTSGGEIGIYARHQPLLGQLVATELRLYRSESEIVRFAQGAGYIQIAADGSTLLLVEEAVDPGSLDSADLRAQLEITERELAEAEAGTEEARLLEHRRDRYRTFIEIADGAAR